MCKKIEFTQEQVEDIIKLHDRGLLNREIGVKYNVSKSTITRVLHENGVAPKHPWLTEEREKSIVECYIKYQNKSIVEKIMHVSGSTISQLLIKYNIEQVDQSKVRQKYTLNEHYFDKLDTSDKCYYFGLLMADGYLNEKNNTLSLSLQIRDIDIIKKFNNAIGSNRPITILKLSDKNPNWSDQAVLNITNKHLRETLVNHGLISNKSLLLQFPEKSVPEEFYAAFILGYSDGDGHYSNNPKDKRVNFIANEWFCEFVQKIVKDNLGVNSSIMYCHGKTEKPTRTFQIAGGNQVKKYLDWLYDSCDVYLERKHKIYIDLYCNDTNNSLSN